MATSFAEGVQSYINADRATVNTAIPAKILNYNPTTQRCVVKPLLDEVLKDGRLFQYPEIEDVPVMFPSTNKSMITFPIAVDDTVLLIFSQRSLDLWLASGDANIVNPDDFRKHDLSDAIVIPGLFSFPRAVNDPLKHTLAHSTDDMVVAHNVGTANENEVRLKDDGTIRISSGTKSVLTLNLDGTVSLDAEVSLTVTVPTTNWIGDINQQGSFTSDTQVTAAGINLTSHTHSGSATAPSGPISDTGAPQ